MILNYFNIKLNYDISDPYEEQIMQEWLGEAEYRSVYECIYEANDAIRVYRILYRNEDDRRHIYHIRNLPEF